MTTPVRLGRQPTWRGAFTGPCGTNVGFWDKGRIPGFKDTRSPVPDTRILDSLIPGHLSYEVTPTDMSRREAVGGSSPSPVVPGEHGIRCTAEADAVMTTQTSYAGPRRVRHLQSVRSETGCAECRHRPRTRDGPMHTAIWNRLSPVPRRGRQEAGLGVQGSGSG